MLGFIDYLEQKVHYFNIPIVRRCLGFHMVRKQVGVVFKSSMKEEDRELLCKVVLVLQLGPNEGTEAWLVQCGLQID